MGRKKLNFKLKDFKKSDAQDAGFKTKVLPRVPIVDSRGPPSIELL